jgi:hypothetical protein
MTFFHKQGADFTEPAGLNGGCVVGTYWNPLIPGLSGLFRPHGFRWCGADFETIDFLIPGVNTVTQLFGIDESRRSLGCYLTFDPVTNETGEQKCFLHDNGFFSVIEQPGAEWTDTVDMNGQGHILIRSSLGVFLLIDGIFFPIEPPEGFRILSGGHDRRC